MLNKMFKNYKEFIENNYSDIQVPDELNLDPIDDLQLIEAFQKSQIIKNLSLTILEKKQKIDNIDDIVSAKLKKFEDEFISNNINSLFKFDRAKIKNLFQLTNCNTLFNASRVERQLSEAYGDLWENIACLSSNIISPEKEFNTKIAGVDIIALFGKDIYFCQMKTKKDTLTGSQKNRSIKELSIHENSLFIAAFDIGGGWNFNSQYTKRIAGKDFWGETDINYDHLLNCIKNAFKNIETSFLSKTS